MRYLRCLICAAALLAGCGPVGGDPDAPDAYDRGTIHISADESFKPVLDAEVQVYEASYPDAKIIVQYKPEAECLKDAMRDSTRMIVTTRSFTQKELAFLTDSFKVYRGKVPSHTMPSPLL